jgi:hypothetical protein
VVSDRRCCMGRWGAMQPVVSALLPRAELPRAELQRAELQRAGLQRSVSHPRWGSSAQALLLRRCPGCGFTAHVLPPCRVRWPRRYRQSGRPRRGHRWPAGTETTGPAAAAATGTYTEIRCGVWRLRRAPIHTETIQPLSAGPPGHPCSDCKQLH